MNLLLLIILMSWFSPSIMEGDQPRRLPPPNKHRLDTPLLGIPPDVYPHH